jgi:hypothetical protein
MDGELREECMRLMLVHFPNGGLHIKGIIMDVSFHDEGTMAVGNHSI